MIMLAFRRTMVGFVRLLVGARADWRGCEPRAGCRIYFANHSSHFDTLALMAALPAGLRSVTHPVAALDYWGRTRVHRFVALDVLHAILIDRKADHRVTDPLAPLASALEAGQSLVLFPEGTRSTGEEVAPFKSGLYHLASRFPNAELVPVFLDNLARIMPKGSPLIVPITCTARFGAPLRLLEGEEKGVFLARAREAVVALSRSGRRNQGP
jgi:1-acyl-sn-glycerol-3-phosphate acyltransferase